MNLNTKAGRSYCYSLIKVVKHLFFSSIFHTTWDLKTKIKISLFTAVTHTHRILWTAFCMCVCVPVWPFLQVDTTDSVVMLSYHSEHSQSFLSLLLKLRIHLILWFYWKQSEFDFLTHQQNMILYLFLFLLSRKCIF